YPQDYQEAPGLPLFRPIVPAPTDSPDGLENFVQRGLFPGSYQVPGSNTSFRFSGFVRLGATFDFKPIGTPDQFVTNTIPVPQTSGQNANFSARPTRLSLDTWTPTPINDWNVHTFLQFDFFSGAAPGVGSSSVPRLRFAFADFGYFRIGQDTTVFMDPQSFPRTADFAGPRGLVNSRQGLARVTIPLSDELFWASAVEQPFSDITTNGMGNNVQDIPDFTSHLRYEADLGHLQASTIVRSIGYRPNGGSTQRDAGWGMNLTGNVFPWALLMGRNPVRELDPTPLERCRFLAQYAFGWGISRYIQDPSGLGFDGAVTANGSFQTLYATGWTLSYEHWYTDHWLTNVTYSADFVGHTDAQPGNTYAGAKYLAASVWWVPVVNMSIGVEYLIGDRKNVNGQTADADRIQTVFQYNF
ncbi:MAG: DcaP family trimeric outer membrane transporter, partial [Planctomycetota bacterium]